MTIRVQCESCGTGFTVGDEAAGKRGRCPKCRAVLMVPRADAPAPPVVPVPVAPAPDAPVPAAPVPAAARADSERPRRGTYRAPPPSPTGFVVPFGAACVGAAVGALVWGFIAKVTGYEVGYVAWGVGGLVGFAAVVAGGRGTELAIGCAVLSLVAILGGKALAFSWTLDSELDEVKSEFTRDLYHENLTDARAFAQLPANAGDEEVRQYMVERRYTAAPSSEGVTAAELREFRQYNVPVLRTFESDYSDYEDWRDAAYAGFRATVESKVSVMEAVKEDIGLLDVIFGLLGVTTAFGIVNGASTPGEDRPPPRRRRPAGRPPARRR